MRSMRFGRGLIISLENDTPADTEVVVVDPAAPVEPLQPEAEVVIVEPVVPVEGEVVPPAAENEVVVPVEPVITTELPEVEAVGSEGSELPEAEADAAVELVETIADGEVQEAEIEQAVRVAEALEAIAISIKHCSNNGGMSRYAAESVGTSVQFMYDLVGIKNVKSTPALESFGSISGRVDGTIALEASIQEQIKVIWDAIIAGIEKAIVLAKEFYTKVMYNFDRLSKRADALLIASSKLDTAKNKELDFTDEKNKVEINSSSIYNAIEIGGAVKKPLESLKFITDILSTTDVCHKYILENVEGFTKAIDGVNSDEEFIAICSLEGASSVPSYKTISGSEAEGYPSVPEDFVMWRSEEYPGNKAILQRVPKNTIKGERVISAYASGDVSITFVKYDLKRKAPEKTVLPVLSMDDVKNVLEKVKELCKAGNGLKSSISKVEDAKKKALEVAKKFKTTDKGKEISKGIKGFCKFVDQPYASISIYTMSTLKAYIDYAEKSMKQYGTVKVEEPTKEEKK